MVPTKKLRYDFFYVLGVSTPEMEIKAGKLAMVPIKKLRYDFLMF